ncbi:hypothetical protein FOZ63_003247 [Perkinsus olseni]|uniref:Transmembrane protein n=1 Tax=Perkinsus olseni TaxID=32597 RepID=A0A7J6QDU6_PEROL|nr:hypothetical protein FOZ63_003247 [Perkinsus olseni]KAF4725067.1 hypothetical protein FOZ62_028860 [Perkinsus olseni]
MSGPSTTHDAGRADGERYQDDVNLVHAFTEALYDHEVRLERHLTRVVYESSRASAQPSMWVRAYLVILLCIGVTALLGLNYVLLYPFLQTLFWVIVAYLLLFPPKQVIKSALLNLFHIPQVTVRSPQEWRSGRRSRPSGSVLVYRDDATSTDRDGYYSATAQFAQDEESTAAPSLLRSRGRGADPPLSPSRAILKMSLRQAMDAVTVLYRCLVYVLLPRDDGGSSLYFRILWRAVILYLYFWKFAWAFPAIYSAIFRYFSIIGVSILVVRWLCGLGKVFLYLHKSRRRTKSSVAGSSTRRSRSRSRSRQASGGRQSTTPSEREACREDRADDDNSVAASESPSCESSSEGPSSDPDSVDDPTSVAEDGGSHTALRRISQRIFTASYDGFLMMWSWCGRVCNNFIKSNADFISASSVMVLFSVLGTVLAAYIGYNISLEFAFLWDAIGSLFRGARSLLEMQAIHPYKQYAELAYSAASDAVSHFIETDSVTTKTRDLYNYIEMVLSGGATNASVPDVSSSSAGEEVFLQCVGSFPGCTYAKGVEDIFDDSYTVGTSGHPAVPLGNTTEVARLLQDWNLKSLVTSPSMLLSAYKEVRQYYDAGANADGPVDRETEDSPTQNSAVTLVGSLLMDLLAASGHASLAGIQFSLSVVSGIVGTLVDSLFHFFFAVTALYYLLQSEQGGLHDYMATVLQVIDPSFYLYNIVRRALKAILYSAIKMSLFHAVYTWLVFSVFDCPVAYIPACIAFVIGLLPVVSPCLVSFFIVPYIFLSYDRGMAQVCGAIATVLNFLVWWYVGPAIYSEIPDANPWMSAVAVGLGVSWFGARGVILGPAIATVPFTLYTVASEWHAGKCGPSGLNRSASVSGLMTPKSDYKEEAFSVDNAKVPSVPSGLLEHLLRQAKESIEREFAGQQQMKAEDGND